MKRNLKGLRVLIFGGAGFIGKATVRAFAEAEAHVIAVGRKEYDALDESLENTKKLEMFVKNCDVIVNLMAVVNAHDTVASRESRIVNIEFPRRLMEVLVKTNSKARVIFSSSQTVYGQTGDTPIDESCFTKPETLYAKQKREAEKIYEEYAKNHNIPVTILRLSNVYGPEAPVNRSVISLFLQRAHENKEITVFGEGDEIRDYVYVDDIAQALLVVATSPMKSLIYNIGSGDYYSISQIVEKIIKILGKGKKINVPFPKGYARYNGDIILDSKKFKEETGWKHKVSLDEGLGKMYKFYKKQ